MMRTTPFLALIFSSVALATPLLDFTSPADLFGRSISSGCSTTGTQTCTNTTAVSDLCCFEYPGGLLAQTQFWDTDPSTGPTDSWTIHGLWPDHCDGTYDSSCDSTRAYTDIGTLLSNQGASDTLAYMETYWVSDDGTAESFWEHEWAKHGTCMSTLKTACLPSGSATGAEAVAFFQTAATLFKVSAEKLWNGLPTYTWLSNAGITPSSTATWTLTELTSALKTQSGYTPALDCTSSVLTQIYWYHNLKGSIIDGDFILIDAPYAGSCPSSGIKYTPKTASSTTTTSTTTTKTTTTGTTATTTKSSSTSTTSTTTTTASGSLPTKGTIKAISSGSTVGGLLTAGTWSTQTLATFTFTGTASSFTMATSKGNCAISSGTLTCASGTTATSFTAVTSGSSLLLAYGDSTAFSSSGIPSGTTAYTVYTGSSYTDAYTLFIVSS